MNKEKVIQAMLTPNMSLSKGEYVDYLLEKIMEENNNLINALEHDKFHVVGSSAALMSDYAESLRIALDA